MTFCESLGEKNQKTPEGKGYRKLERCIRALQKLVSARGGPTRLQEKLPAGAAAPRIRLQQAPAGGVHPQCQLALQAFGNPSLPYLVKQ